MKDKKAQGMTITTLIVIILAVVVLALLLFWFLGGGGQIGSWINNFFGKPNVATISTACQTACVTESKYDYCIRERELVLEDKTKIPGTCYIFAKEHSNLGFESCNIDCGTVVEEKIYDGIIDASIACDDECNKIVSDWPKAAKDAICGKKVKYLDSGKIETKTCEEIGKERTEETGIDYICKTNCA
ncbi:MAG TPA: hypothetical protein VMZ91_11025 [Candidatus Paceibacterota bacterium]|nr:hypothetical protein [Candidatus Paceibacterota bacterium]